jgi:adenosylhomocysteine nucleosidase
MSNLEIKACHFGIVFALGIESGGLEDLLSGAIRIRTHGDWLRSRGKRRLSPSLSASPGLFIKEGGLKGRRVVIIRSGAGRENAARAAEVLIAGHRPEILISAGFAGGLSPTLKRHDILLADSVIDSSGRQIILNQSPPHNDISNEGQTPPCPLAHFPFDQSKLNWPNLQIGKLLSVDHVVREPSEKQSLHQQHQALAVDMETFAVAEVCRRRSVPLCAIRIIHDAANDILPPDIERLLRQKTEAARLGAALGAIWRRPGSVKDLWAMKENSLVGSAQLAKFIEQLIEK